VEITYGLERIAMYLQGVESVWDLAWDEHHTYGEILLDQEIDYSVTSSNTRGSRTQEMYRLFEERRCAVWI
jgi:glycyl-tRNA synthetase alpha chain